MWRRSPVICPTAAVFTRSSAEFRIGHDQHIIPVSGSAQALFKVFDSLCKLSHQAGVPVYLICMGIKATQFDLENLRADFFADSARYQIKLSDQSGGAFG